MRRKKEGEGRQILLYGYFFFWERKKENNAEGEEEAPDIICACVLVRCGYRLEILVEPSLFPFSFFLLLFLFYSFLPCLTLGESVAAVHTKRPASGGVCFALLRCCQSSNGRGRHQGREQKKKLTILLTRTEKEDPRGATGTRRWPDAVCILECPDLDPEIMTKRAGQGEGSRHSQRTRTAGHNHRGGDRISGTPWADGWGTTTGFSSHLLAPLQRLLFQKSRLDGYAFTRFPWGMARGIVGDWERAWAGTKTVCS